MAQATPTNREMNVDELQTLWDELNAPSAEAFHRALARRGVKARLKDVQEFVRSRSERQVIAPPPKYTGHIVAHSIDHKWAADLIDFTTRPTKKATDSRERRQTQEEEDDGEEASRRSNFARLRPIKPDEAPTMRHVLIVQDVFSRQVFVKPLQSVSETTEAFKEIITESGRTPMRLDTDGGNEFTSALFKRLMTESRIEHRVKDKEDLNAIATVDAAIGQLKRAIKRRRERHGGTWLDHLDAAVRGDNSTPHSTTGAPPEAMTDDVIFSERKEAAEHQAENLKQMERRQARLEKDGAFRVYAGKKKGLKRRVDEAAWSDEIYTVASFPEPGVVLDTGGRRHLTKLVKPVPVDSSGANTAPAEQQQAKSKAPFLQVLREYAVALRDLLGGKGEVARRSVERAQLAKTKRNRSTQPCQHVIQPPGGFFP